MKLNHDTKTIPSLCLRQQTTFVRVHEIGTNKNLTVAVTSDGQVQSIQVGGCALDEAIEMLTYAKEQV